MDFLNFLIVIFGDIVGDEDLDDEPDYSDDDEDIDYSVDIFAEPMIMPVEFKSKKELLEKFDVAEEVKNE